MSTTTDRQDERLGPRRVAGYCALALGVWFGALLIGALAFEPTKAVMVFAPGGGAVIASARSADVDLLEASGSLFTVAGRSAGFVRRLYASGAWFVLPAMSGGCRTLSPFRAPQIS
jgi:hypothetical protein